MSDHLSETEANLSCPRCGAEGDNGEEGVWCEGCELLYERCSCGSSLSLVAVIGYPEDLESYRGLRELERGCAEEEIWRSRSKEAGSCDWEDTSAVVFVPDGDGPRIDCPCDCCEYFWKCGECGALVSTHPD